MESSIGRWNGGTLMRSLPTWIIHKNLMTTPALTGRWPHIIPHDSCGETSTRRGNTQKKMEDSPRYLNNLSVLADLYWKNEFLRINKDQCESGTRECKKKHSKYRASKKNHSMGGSRMAFFVSKGFDVKYAS